MENLIMEPAAELPSGYKLVPWSSWDQWNFVRDSIFSSSADSIAAALRRVSAWRSRGCLPVPIDVTAAIIEVQQKDPFFREGPTDDALGSEEILAMLYCMAIIRLVNGFVEPIHKITGRSISELADDIGIPRMLVDIRHESSHRNLPSLRLVRIASIKALDWLKSNYWEPQRNAIPNVRKEIKSRLREMTYYLKHKHAQKFKSSQIKGTRIKRSMLLMGCNKLSSHITGKLWSHKSDGFGKQLSRISKVIAQLYSAYPSEVVSVLLELFQFQELHFPNEGEMEHSENSNGFPFPVRGSIHDLKRTITNLPLRRPRSLLSLLKTVLKMIEAEESMLHEKSDHRFLSREHQGRACQITHLSSLVSWLLVSLKALNDSGKIRLIEENYVPFEDKSSVPRASLAELLRKALILSASGEKYLMDSVLLLAEMIGSRSLSQKLKKHPLLRLEKDRYLEEHSTSFHMEADFIKKAENKLKLLKSRKRGRRTNIDVDRVSSDGGWIVADSWKPCPVGTLPCSFISSPILPVLDKVADGLETKEIEGKKAGIEVQSVLGLSVIACNAENSENGVATVKGLKGLGSSEIESPMEGRLLIDGVWTKVSNEQLLVFESSSRIFT